MDTTPNLHPVLTHYLAWFKAHERFLVIVLAAFVLFKGGQGIENIILHHDQNKANQAATAVVTDTTQNKDLTAQLQQLKTDSDKQSALLNTQIQNATIALQKQQALDAQANQQQIIDRWKLLLPIKGGVTPVNGGDTITPEAANQTVQALERIPVLELQVSDLNAKILIDDSVIGKQDDLITGLNKQIVDEKTSHAADVKLEKAKSRRSWFSGFKIGIVVGAVGTEAIRVWAGHP